MPSCLCKKQGATAFRRTAGVSAKTEHLSERRIEKGERRIWQRRFWEHFIRDERDFESHVDYIHHNPVKHGHVRTVGEWPFSSFHR